MGQQSFQLGGPVGQMDGLHDPADARNGEER